MSKVSNVSFSADRQSKILYKVSFTWSDDYRPKVAGVCSMTTVVESSNKFEALATAWEQAEKLRSDEPTNMDVRRVEVCE